MRNVLALYCLRNNATRGELRGRLLERLPLWNKKELGKWDHLQLNYRARELSQRALMKGMKKLDPETGIREEAQIMVPEKDYQSMVKKTPLIGPTVEAKKKKITPRVIPFGKDLILATPSPQGTQVITLIPDIGRTQVTLTAPSGKDGMMTRRLQVSGSSLVQEKETSLKDTESIPIERVERS